MTSWETIANHFNATAKCRRKKDGKPQVQHEPGCTFICCEATNCACAMNGHGDEPLTQFLARWQEMHGEKR